MRTLSCKQFKFVGQGSSLFYVRLFSKLDVPQPLNNFNPFKKKTYIPVKQETDSRNASRIYITILGNGGIGQPRCVGLFTEFKGYLFNCGEGVGRYCREYIINTCLIKHVFITQKKWENISGLSDIYITNETYGVYHMSLYGPPGVEHFFSMLSSQSRITKVSKKEGGYIDHTVNVDYIPITNKKETLPFFTFGKKHYLKDKPDVVYSYVCKIFEKPGDFLVEKCIEYGVPIGPDLLKLKNWENIVLPDGKTVYAEDVHSPSYPERIILIVDCPSESFLESFVNEKKFKMYQIPLHPTSKISVFHFTPEHIFKSGRYQDWMARFCRNTEHFILNSCNPVISSNVVHQTHKYLNLLHPEIFSTLKEKEIPEQDSFNDKLIHPPPMMQICVRPKQEFNWSNVVQGENNINIGLDGINIVMDSPEFYKKLNDLKSSLLQRSLLNVNKSIYPEVVFLGTSSATSTAYRNVSAILLNSSPNSSILLDCGEGTVMQFTRYFGPDMCSVLQKISCIFISHKHLDHYLGLFNLISERMKAFENSGVPYKPVTLILPFEIEHIFKRFCEAFENLRSAARIFRCHYFGKKGNNIKHNVGDFEILTVPVKHCTDAWGIVVESGSQWKIVYSGDTAPCQALIDAGKDCTLLIHEASIEDDMVNEALAKRHSTPSQVIDIAEKMNAQHTIMTHFSKRYLAFPVLPERSSMEITCAFDFMKVRICDLPLLPLFTPVVKCLFQPHIASHEEKSSCVVNFENVFLKVLQT